MVKVTKQQGFMGLPVVPAGGARESVASAPSSKAPAKDWAGREVKCDHCGSILTEYIKDVEHDGGDCEVFECLACNHRIHVELPD